jgi:hypothetical protein
VEGRRLVRFARNSILFRFLLMLYVNDESKKKRRDDNRKRN